MLRYTDLTHPQERSAGDSHFVTTCHRGKTGNLGLAEQLCPSRSTRQLGAVLILPQPFSAD